MSVLIDEGYVERHQVLLLGPSTMIPCSMLNRKDHHFMITARDVAIIENTYNHLVAQPDHWEYQKLVEFHTNTFKAAQEESKPCRPPQPPCRVPAPKTHILLLLEKIG
jgi:hypothetical protein